jgi:hypothetical protein
MTDFSSSTGGVESRFSEAPSSATGMETVRLLEDIKGILERIEMKRSM